MSVSACIALLKAEVERKRTPTSIISWPVRGSSPLTRPSESSKRDSVRTPVDTVCCRSCRLANAQLILELSLNNALSQIGQDSRGNSTDFSPDGFRSSNPTTPASQSVSNAYEEIDPNPRFVFFTLERPRWVVTFLSLRGAAVLSWPREPKSAGVRHRYIR